MDPPEAFGNGRGAKPRARIMCARNLRLSRGAIRVNGSWVIGKGLPGWKAPRFFKNQNLVFEKPAQPNPPFPIFSQFLVQFQQHPPFKMRERGSVTCLLGPPRRHWGQPPKRPLPPTQISNLTRQKTCTPPGQNFSEARKKVSRLSNGDLRGLGCTFLRVFTPAF